MNPRASASLASWFGVPALAGAALMNLAFSLTPLTLNAIEWTQYRGPNHDLVSPETIRLNWNETAPQVVWRVPLQPGLSSLTIGGGRVFTLVRRGTTSSGQEYCVALNAETGAELWSSAVGLASYPHGGVGGDDGPRSTPAIVGDRVIVLGSYQRLSCFNAATGQIIWSRELTQDFGGEVIAWQSAASPVVENGLVFVNGNGNAGQRLLAFRVTDGSLAWSAHDDRMTHATPAIATIRGTRQVVFYSQSGLVSVLPETGQALWRYALSYNDTSAAASPVIVGDRVYASRAYPTRAGAVFVGVTGSGTAQTVSAVWTKPNSSSFMNHWCTPVHYNGYLYGMFGQNTLNFRCIDLNAGVVKWTMPGFGYGSVMAVSGKIMALSEDGQLVLVDPNPEAYTEIARLQAVTGKCWNAPAVSDGRIYVRSTTEAVALDVFVKPPPRLKLWPNLSSAGLFELAIEAEDGSAIDQSRGSTIRLFSTDDPALNAANWQAVVEAPTLQGGKLKLSVPANSTPQRLYQTREDR